MIKHFEIEPNYEFNEYFENSYKETQKTLINTNQ